MVRFPTAKTAVSLLGCALIAAAWVHPLCAETGGVFALPVGAAAPANGLRMTIDSRWVVGSGYHPVKVTIGLQPVVPSPRQRTFRVELRMHGTVQQEPNLISQFLEIEQGNISGTATILVPQTDAWTMADVSIYEDGGLRSEISGRLSLQQASLDDVSESRPAALFIDDTAPAVDDRLQLIAELQTGQRPNERRTPWVSALTGLRYRRNTSMQFRNRPNDLQVLGQLQTDKRGAMLPTDSLPNHWLAYTGLDLVVCTLDQWKTLQKDDPERYATVRQWIRAGGNLVLVDPDMQGRVGELAPAIGVDGESPKSHQVIGGGLNMQNSGITYSEPGYEPPPNPNLKKGEINRIWTVQLGMGQAVAVEGVLTDFQPQSFRQILNTMSSSRWAWFQRHGISNLRFGNDYHSYAIPGVGEPPLLTFLGSITLFVIAIGPVNYLLLRRWRRLYLLLVTVPVGAAIVTGTIFLVALVADGLGTRVMVRSCTVLDQPRGEATTWSRQTYYAGVKPSRGLVFNDQTAVYPILNPSVNLRRETRRSPRLLHWEDGKQQMADGYLPARRMEQFLVIQPETTKAAVTVTANESGLTIVNQLGADIHVLVLRDETGALYLARNVKNAEEAVMTSTNAPGALGELRKLIADRNPINVQSPRSVRYNYQYERWQYQQIDNDAGAVQFPSSRMEKLIQFAVNLPPKGGYFAILRQSPWAETGAEAILVDGGLHLVRARWK